MSGYWSDPNDSSSLEESVELLSEDSSTVGSAARKLLCECVAEASQTVEGGQLKDPYCISHVISCLCCDVLELV